MDNRTIAIAKLNLDQMDRAQAAQQSAENSGVERQAKMQGIEQGALTMADQKKTRDMFSAYENEKDLAAKASLLSMYKARTGKGAEYKTAAGGSSVDANGNVIKTPDVIYNAEDGRVVNAQAQPVQSSVSEEARAAVATGKITKAEANKRLVAAGHQPI